MYSITGSRREPPLGEEERPFDLSYWEALRAYWRYYWPPQLLVLFSAPLVKLFPALALVLTVPVVAIAFFGGWLFVSRLHSRPYRGFSLVIVETPAEVDVPRLGLERVTKVWFFLWWRQMAAGVFGAILMMPLNFARRRRFAQCGNGERVRWRRVRRD